VFLIDGYNLLHALKTTRESLIALLVNACADHARIIFDPTGGMARRERRGGVEIVSVVQGRTADEEILATLSATNDRTRYTVVTNDREIAQAAEKRSVKVMTCEEFARLLAPPSEGSEKPDSVSPGEVDDWMDKFGLDDKV
jgi:rRNA-processing protein FCF1